MKSIKGHSLWKKAVQLIPGGNGLLSKRPDRYVPDLWPNYFSKASGIEVFDLDGNRFKDMAQMGIGSAILGYAHPELTEAVTRSISDGVNCTLNSPEEVYLAETLLDLNPHFAGARFAKTGAEAMSIAVRVARSHTGRDKVLFSGYHGWSDWYLATNIGNTTGLDEHLIPGLSTSGVPAGLANTVVPFLYNDIEDFERVLEANPDAGTICIEGARYDFAEKEFLDRIQEVASRRGLLIISDEITSGWRVTDGGVYKLSNFLPDLIVYAKAMGGGYAISAVLGTKEVMDSAQGTFMSSTMWTERVGFTAALSTIDILTRNRVWEHLIDIGEYIGEKWRAAAEKHGLRIAISGFKPLITMKFGYGELNQVITTLFIQEMLSRGYLASTSVYVSYAHTKKDIDEYAHSLDLVFAVISEALEKGDVNERLKTKVRSDSFNRLT